MSRARTYTGDSAGHFVMIKLIEGALQAVGALVVYALVIWSLIAGFGSVYLKDALFVKTGGVLTSAPPQGSE